MNIFLISLSFFRSFFEAPLKVEPKEAWVYCQFMTASTMGERLLTSLPSPSLDENLKLFLAFFTFFSQPIAHQSCLAKHFFLQYFSAYFWIAAQNKKLLFIRNATVGLSWRVNSASFEEQNYVEHPSG